MCFGERRMFALQLLMMQNRCVWWLWERGDSGLCLRPVNVCFTLTRAGMLQAGGTVLCFPAHRTLLTHLLSALPHGRVCCSSKLAQRLSVYNTEQFQPAPASIHCPSLQLSHHSGPVTPSFTCLPERQNQPLKARVLLTLL